MLEKQQKRKKRVHAVFLSSRIYTTIPKSNIKIVERGIHLIPLTHKYMIDHFPGSIYLFILKKMGVAIIDFRVCPPLVKWKLLCQNEQKFGGKHLMLEKQQKRKKRVHAVFLSSRIYTDFVWGK
jgi:hypothetical protein